MSKLALKTLLVIATLIVVSGAALAQLPPVETFMLDNYATAPYQNEPGYGFAYESTCQSPGSDVFGSEYYDWWYYYKLENDSTDHQIVSWSWIDPLSATSWWEGPVFVGVHEFTNVDTNVDPAGMPLPAAPNVSLASSYYRAEDFSDFDEKVELQSIITWDDGHTEMVPIYAPSGYRESMGGSLVTVPEPGSVVAMCCGLIGLVGFAKRRRSR